MPAVFPFPGGKSQLASWILDYLPEHECYVEAFGGAAGLLVDKEPSPVEVYNDSDSDLVHFFRVLRTQPDELGAWLDAVPYAREVHERWVERFYNGYRPADDIERAGRFFYLRYSQFGAGYGSPNGFGTSKVNNQATSFANKLERLEEFADRFDDVVLENLDWTEVLKKYDGPDTVFYCDPPYLDQGEYYPAGGIDHEAFGEALLDLEGQFLCSYTEVPESLRDQPLVTKNSKMFMGSGTSGSAKDAEESLVLGLDSEESTEERARRPG